MSSTNRGATRAPLDAYYTPDAVASACVATIAAELDFATVLEPHAGGGAFVRALEAANAGIIHANDVDPEAAGLRDRGVTVATSVDFLALAVDEQPDWIVGNPPYGAAEAHVRRALAVSTAGVAFLLRLAFLESTKRLAFWREYPPAEVHVLSRRPSFTGGGTDSAAYGWFIWRIGRDAKEPTTLHWIDWSEVTRD